MAGVLLREEERHKGRKPCADGGRNCREASISPRIAGQGLLAITTSQERGMEQIRPQSPQNEPTPPTTLLRTFSLQNCKAIHISSFQPPSLQYYVVADLGNDYNPKGHAISKRLIGVSEQTSRISIYGNTKLPNTS